MGKGGEQVEFHRGQWQLRPVRTQQSLRVEIEPKLGFVTLDVQNPTDATTVTIGGEDVRRAAWSEPAPVAPGATDVVVSTPGHQPAKRTVTLAAGQKMTLPIDAMSGEAVRKQELDIAKALVNSLAAAWDPSKYTDQYRDNLLRIIQGKVKGRKVELARVTEPRQGEVIDLMERLRRSLAQSGHKRGARKSKKKRATHAA